jgi:hypothetical protein
MPYHLRTPVSRPFTPISANAHWEGYVFGSLHTLPSLGIAERNFEKQGADDPHLVQAAQTGRSG